MVNEKNMPQPLLIGLLIIGGGLIIVAFYLGFVLLNSNTEVHAATEATTVAEIATHLATIQPTPTRIVTATPSAVPLPNSCAMLKQQQPAAEDGPHTIYLQGKTAVTLYCHNMADIPTEYLTLPATANGGNFSLISYPEGAIVTLYEKVRLNPSSLIIDPTDMTFATTADSLAGYNAISGEQLALYPVTASDFAVATGCNRNLADTPLGRANIDLSGTPFVVSGEMTFTSIGGDVQQTIGEVSDDGKVVNLAVNGRCGIMQPNGPIQLVYQQP
ncbi:MAG: hypothetical protein H6656_10050 [Ardenticatenaceae bacterium]|nr:hypothetical protein [Ardenticatenaceae bacterium]